MFVTRNQLAVLLVTIATVSQCSAADMECVRVCDEGKEFALAESGQPFIPWGFKSKGTASEWVGFYWGKGQTADVAIALTSLELFQEKTPQSSFTNVACEGTYRHHVQGICTNNKDAIFWSFTTTLVKTNTTGKVLKQIDVANHHGDLCFHNGKVYVAVNFGSFNNPKGKADNWVYVYNAGDLSVLAKHKTPQVFHGAGGIANHGGKFIVVGGLPEDVKENYLYEYDKKFKFVKKHVVKSGYTRLGIQTAGFTDGRWWFGCYGNKVLVTDESFKLVGKFDFNCGVGIVGIRGGKFLIGRGGGNGNKRTAKALVARADEETGLVIRPMPNK